MKGSNLYNVQIVSRMSVGTEYLSFVSEKLKNRLSDLTEKLHEGQRDVENMHEYYWQNYTEMDEYGYENFDNQQALLLQVNANTENQKMAVRFKKLIDSPFFGSVDFVYEGEEIPERFYIGMANFSERAGQIPLIYDWRAPVSGLFYDYDKGEASYQAPGGLMEGEILSKWQYKIRDGRMIYEFESDTKIDDDILKEELGANSDVQLKNIVRTIQKEQNAIIRNTKDKIMAIQGAAGSGKTSIALHRIAYLLYHDREHLKSSNILILSPNSVFSNYISHILPELGEENIQEMTLDLFAYRQLNGIVSDCQDRFDFIEEQIAGIKSEHYAWKQSKACVQAMDAFLFDLEDRLVEFHDIEYKGFLKTADEFMDLFYNRLPDIPLLTRIDQLLENYIDEYETLRNTSLSEENREILHEKFYKMYLTTDVYELYNWFLEDNDLPVLDRDDPEHRVLAYEDVYPILYLKTRLFGARKNRFIRHLIIDEMQDYSYLQYVIFSHLFQCNMTILGDRAQTIDEKKQDVLQYLPKIFGRRMRCIEINKSYRNTAEIAAYAESVSGVEGIEYLERHGKPVEQIKKDDFMQLADEIISRVRLGAEGYETAVVLTMTEKEAVESYQYLKDRVSRVTYIDRDSSKFEKGITVTTFYHAKGLEFDQVFLLGGNPENSYYKQFQYIGATRALHELYVLEYGSAEVEK